VRRRVPARRTEETEVVDEHLADDERDPFAPVVASPRLATPLALVAFALAIAAAFGRMEMVAGPLGMAVGLIAHVKGSRLGLPAAVVAGLAMIVGMAITMTLR
jgi:hypothetical protein